MNWEKHEELKIKKENFFFELNVIIQNIENYSESFINEQFNLYKDKILEIDKQFINEESNYYEIEQLIKETLSKFEKLQFTREEQEHKDRIERIKANARRGSIINSSIVNIDNESEEKDSNTETFNSDNKPKLEPIPDTSHLKKKVNR